MQESLLRNHYEYVVIMNIAVLVNVDWIPEGKINDSGNLRHLYPYADQEDKRSAYMSRPFFVAFAVVQRKGRDPEVNANKDPLASPS
ncbi:hypothetical protein PM082_003703 [Marasmius tenuissimus]|nr:hypothetical protein PM082_003703 [Marasmius tenuissimus]